MRRCDVCVTAVTSGRSAKEQIRHRALLVGSAGSLEGLTLVGEAREELLPGGDERPGAEILEDPPILLLPAASHLRVKYSRRSAAIRSLSRRVLSTSKRKSSRAMLAEGGSLIGASPRARAARSRDEIPR